MHKFCSSSFFTGIFILVVAEIIGGIKDQIPLAIWTVGMAVGMLSSKPSG
jgi:hypothetical protein